MSRMSLRKREGKAAPLAQAGALYPDFTAHRLRQRLGDRQANAGTAEGARTRFVNTIEAFEDVRELLLSKTHAGIGDAEGHRVLFAAYSKLDLARRGRVAQGIDQQVREDLHGAGRVGHDQRKVLRHMDLECKAFLSKLPFKRLERVLDEALWRNRLQGERNLARLGPRQFLQIVHQTTQTSRFGMQHGPGLWSWLDHSVEQAFEVAFERGDRGAQFVRHIANDL